MMNDAPAMVGGTLTLEAFLQLAGTLGGYSFVKLVVDTHKGDVHFINNRAYAYHADYIAERILEIPIEVMEQDLDAFNDSLYRATERRFFLGILALHTDAKRAQDRRFFSIETVEVDTMNATQLQSLYAAVRKGVDPAIPLFLKPANHQQEADIASIPPAQLPRVSAHEIFSSAEFIPLHPGVARGRLRAFRSEEEYFAAAASIEWYDIIAMHRVPENIPRICGIINADHTTPLSHTNVLASGWQIPNAIQIGIFDRIAAERLNEQWVEYSVEMTQTAISLKPISRPEEADRRPAWSIERIKLEEPELARTPIVNLDKLRMTDRYKYGTKAANLGELGHILQHGSDRLLGFYKVRRPPRANLLPYLARHLGVPENADFAHEVSAYLSSLIQIPRGIAIPFAVQQQFLESSPRIQQTIGKLKMALELNAREIEPLCLSLQQQIRAHRIPETMRTYIDHHISEHLSGVSSFVVRSSSNAEDLAGFSAAGIYESINRVKSSDELFRCIKEVWSSLLSPRSVRLRQQVGISLDDCYMGVVVQEEVHATMGGVMVTTNPMASGKDFRNVYINVSTHSVTDVVSGSELPLQYLYNTVEGGGRTLSLGSSKTDLADAQKKQLQKLAVVGRLLQAHFSPTYTFDDPVDIEWIGGPEGIHILQLRPYTK